MAQSRWHAMFDTYQVMSTDELLYVQWVELSVPVRSIISKPRTRVPCSSCSEDIINGRERILDGKPVCAACARESYWRSLEDGH